jgi:hypothetical protein
VYQRQIYKQQHANAVMDNSMEKRLFEGIQVRSDRFTISSIEI